jgi:hypothetical protein
MNRKHVIFSLVTLGACISTPTEVDRKTDHFTYATVSSRSTDRSIEAKVSGTASTATLNWDTSIFATFKMHDASINVSFSGDLEPTLEVANQAAYLLWLGNQTPPPPQVSGDSSWLGCECYWSPNACSGQGAISCGCVWNDISNTCCGSSCC